jgi:molybdopterin molybdotransferase
MARLSDDCFAAGGDLLTVAAALARIDERVAAAVEIETVPLARTAGRVLARDLVAPIDLPPYANSAVDGYALAHADLAPAGATVLPVGGRAAAGHPLDRKLRPGEAIRVFTGAPMPEGADTVMMQEDCVVEAGRVRLKPGIAKGANRRLAGEDVARGLVAIAAGRRLGPAELGLAAALGQSALTVFRTLRVALLSTGDEVREPGLPLPPGTIYDANRFILAALLTGLGCAVSDFGIRPDREAVLADTIAAARVGHDLIVTSGGVSTGDEDHVRAAIERQGSLHFWRLAIKPGRPVALGQVGGVPLIGLPGNPVAAVVTFAVLARPLILKLAGAVAAAPRLYPVRAGFAYKKKPGRREYLRARLERDGAALVAIRFERDGAGIISSIVRSDGLVVVDEPTRELAAGSIVDFLPFAEVIA